MDWHSIARLLAEQSATPIIVLDRQGSVRLVNASFERCLGWSRYDIVGSPWIDRCTPPGAREGAKAWLQDALRGAIRSYDLQAQTRHGRRMLLTVEGSLVCEGEHPALLLRVERATAISEAPGPVDEIYYEVSTSGDEFGRLRWTSSPDRARGRHCFQAFHGLDEPCPDCPAREVNNLPSTAIRHRADNERVFEVVTASRTTQDTASVHLVRLSERVFSDMVQAKLGALARAAGLSEREQAVLRYLTMGRAVADIAEILGISPRTVKFHQANIIEKLGVDSRVDLMRLIL